MKTILKNQSDISCTPSGGVATIDITPPRGPLRACWRGTPSLGENKSSSYNVRYVRARFWNKINKTKTCWLWLGDKNENGYGRISINGKSVKAHRFSYESIVGPIPPGLTLDHICKVRNCVNPAHLRPMTLRENVLCGDGIGVRNGKKTHCKNGHEFSQENTFLRNKRGYRSCRTCMKRSTKKWLQKLAYVSLFLFSFSSSVFAERASWYSTETCKINKDQNCPTASGKSIYKLEKNHAHFAASYAYPLGTRVKVTNLGNDKSTVVRVLDRGPNKRLNRKIDLGKEAFAEIADPRRGLISVRTEVIP